MNVFFVKTGISKSFLLSTSVLILADLVTLRLAGSKVWGRWGGWLLKIKVETEKK